ncbi:mobile element transfer protein [Streptomyces apocyni]|uniref:mobile element transfer protein n=1 Tax=Streptomyces apocyni TaxID=2654677 RepID=UPI0012EA16E6|nr:mobile element transfer protein [Streptomyces apocyni]
MPIGYIIRKLSQKGPITVGTAHTRRGQITYVASCGAEDCGWSVEHATVTAVEVAAQGHRCRVR